MVAELALRFALGGAVVSTFAVLGELFEPKTFAGVFGAAPSVALASLGLAFGHSGPAYVGTSAGAMVAGAIGFLAYASTCVVLMGRRVHTWVVSVAAALIADWKGPAIGGLFLAFPAILPASLTLVRRHDGRARARDDARGARIGALGLARFAAAVWALAGAGASAVITLGAALGLWAGLCFVLWRAIHGCNDRVAAGR